MLKMLNERRGSLCTVLEEMSVFTNGFHLWRVEMHHSLDARHLYP